MHDTLFRAIKEDHGLFEELLDQMRQRGAGAAKARQALLERLTSRMLPHMYGEESGLYAMLKQHGESREQALQAYEEHHVARVMLDELRTLPVTDDAWLAKAAVASEIILHHIDEEEVLFDLAEDVLSEAEAAKALAIFREEERAELAAR